MWTVRERERESTRDRQTMMEADGKNRCTEREGDGRTEGRKGNKKEKGKCSKRLPFIKSTHFLLVSSDLP